MLHPKDTIAALRAANEYGAFPHHETLSMIASCLVPAGVILLFAPARLRISFPTWTGNGF